MCYSEQYVQVIAQQVDSGIVAWMQSVTANIMWKACTAGEQWYFSLNGVCYSEQYVEVIAQQFDSCIVAWM